MPGSILLVHYETTTGKYLVQKAGSDQIADLAITSAKIGLLAVGTPHIADLNVTSAKLAAAIIGLLGTVADEAITSAKLASGAVGGVHILDGSIGTVDLGDGIVTSAKIGASVIGGIHILDGSILGADLADLAVVSAKIGALAVGTPHLGAGAVVSGKVGAGAIGDVLLKDFGLISGKYASGSITEGALASGISIDISELSQEPSYRAETLISAYLGVQFSISGYFNYAQAAAIGTMPAVGLAIANIASGAIGTFQYQGRMTNPAWNFSGYVGELLFLGTSSQVTLTAPSASGQCAQRIGKVVAPSTIFARPELQYVQLAE